MGVYKVNMVVQKVDMGVYKVDVGAYKVDVGVQGVYWYIRVYMGIYKITEIVRVI